MAAASVLVFYGRGKGFQMCCHFFNQHSYAWNELLKKFGRTVIWTQGRWLWGANSIPPLLPQKWTTFTNLMHDPYKSAPLFYHTLEEGREVVMEMMHLSYILFNRFTLLSKIMISTGRKKMWWIGWWSQLKNRANYPGLISVRARSNYSS